MTFVVKNPPVNAEDIRDTGSIPGLGRSPGGGRGNSFQYLCLGSLHGQGNLAGYSPQAGRESNMTEMTCSHADTHGHSWASWWLSGKESICQCRRCRFNP